jgi:hypothetical protein
VLTLGVGPSWITNAHNDLLRFERKTVTHALKTFSPSAVGYKVD